VLLTLAVLVVYRERLGAGPNVARGLALATLILGYQILVLVERAGAFRGLADLFPRSIRFWLIWLAAAASLPILMYVPGTAALMNIRPMSPASWAIALGAAGAAVGWRLISPPRESSGTTGALTPQGEPCLRPARQGLTDNS